MSTNVIMPQLGESVVEGTVGKWLKREGDRVNEFDPILEVNTDKVDTEIPSPAAGVSRTINQSRVPTEAWRATIWATLRAPCNIPEPPSGPASHKNSTALQTSILLAIASCHRRAKSSG